MVCMGNICRSPTAEAVLKHHIKQQGLNVKVDSAGTLGIHRGNRPDPRSVRVAEARGYDFSRIKSRPVEDKDFKKFDFILAMDQDNLSELQAKCPAEYQHKLQLILSYGICDENEVPDPYYGGSKGFDLVLDLIESSMKGLLTAIKRQSY